MDKHIFKTKSKHVNLNLEIEDFNHDPLGFSDGDGTTPETS